MKKAISLSAIVLVSVIVMATLVVGIYDAVTGGRTLLDLGWQGLIARPLPSDLSDSTSAWPTYKGTLVEMGEHFILETEDGQTIELGTGPSTYFETLDFALSVGDQISATGFHEDGEFKVKDLTNHTTGQSVTLRDDTGKPAWAGQGRRRNA